MQETYKILSKVSFPSDIKELPLTDLPQLCDEVRHFILDTTSKNPGHLGAALGVVELTVALHYVFDTPNDKIIWDVGHQAYAHKILTGRKDNFHTNRKFKGVSGFPKMSESEYDAFGTGHSSTSISAALGMAIAAKLDGNDTEQHIAVIGDGAMTGGMAMEAMNNAGVSNANILVILNDNGIAIDKSVGSLSRYLTSITTSKSYNNLKNNIWYMMGGSKNYGENSRELVKQIGGGLKSTLLKRSNLFEAFGLRYFGPVGGHDVLQLVRLFEDVKKIKGPRLLHIITTKGKGFKQAEKQQTLFHAPGKFDMNTGELVAKSNEPEPPKFQDVFGKTIVELAKENKKIIGITPAMPTGSSLNIMMEQIPDRAFDVGIAEQHAVTFSAGMATKGFIPFCNIYSSFMQRAYDQVIHDVALQNLHVVFCIDRAGIVGEDGATHHGAFDLAYFRPIPYLTICSPLNEEELRNMMYTAQLDNKGATVIRYPRGKGVMLDWEKPLQEIQVGKGEKLIDGKDIALVSIGPIGNTLVNISEKLKTENKISAAVYNMRYLKPIDEELLHEIFKNYKYIFTFEDGVIQGGLGTAVIEFANDNKYHKSNIVRFGIDDVFVEHGTVKELYKEAGLDTENIVRRILQEYNN